MLRYVAAAVLIDDKGTYPVDSLKEYKKERERWLRTIRERRRPAVSLGGSMNGLCFVLSLDVDTADHIVDKRRPYGVAEKAERILREGLKRLG